MMLKIRQDSRRVHGGSHTRCRHIPTKAEAFGFLLASALLVPRSLARWAPVAAITGAAVAITVTAAASRSAALLPSHVPPPPPPPCCVYGVAMAAVMVGMSVMVTRGYGRGGYRRGGYGRGGYGRCKFVDQKLAAVEHQFLAKSQHASRRRRALSLIAS